MQIVKNILCLLFGLLFINAGLDKFFHYMPMPKLDIGMQKIYDAFATITWLMPLVAVIEIVGGLLFIFPKTRNLGAIIIFPILVGIITHNAIFMPSGLIIALVLFIIWLWVIFDHWDKYKKLID